MLQSMILFVSRQTMLYRCTFSGRRQNAHQLLAQLHTQTVHWQTAEELRKCKLLSFKLSAPKEEKPLKAYTINDETSCSEAMKLIKSGYAAVYTGNYNNARQLINAIKKRYSRQVKALALQKSKSITRFWMQTREFQREQAEVLNNLLIQIGLCENNKPCELLDMKKPRANRKRILEFAFRNDEDAFANDHNKVDRFLLSLNDFIGMIGSFEWNKKGVYVHEFQEYIYPHWGVFPPTRQDYTALLGYVELDNSQPIKMLEVGIGTGILSFILLKEGKVQHVLGTDINRYAIACTRENAEKLGLSDKIELEQTDLFPKSSTEKYDVILFNPPWLPGNHSTSLDLAVYDTSNQDILRRFLSGVQNRLHPNGHVYIILSDLGILLGLYNKQDLNQMFKEAGLVVVEEHRSLTEEELVEKNWPPDLSQTTSIKKAKAHEVVSLFHLRLRQT